jgi:hypothetical protein
MSVLGTVMIQQADRITDALAPLLADVTSG